MKLQDVLLLLTALAGLIFGTFCARTALGAQVEAFEARRAYESAISELEGFRRTKGNHIDTAYVCKLRF